MKLSGYESICDAYGRTQQQLRKWKKLGAPFEKEGRTVVVETEALDAWIEETSHGSRSRGNEKRRIATPMDVNPVQLDEEGNPVKSLNQLARELDEKKLKKADVDLRKAERLEALASNEMARREEMEEAYERGLREIKKWVDKFVKSQIRPGTSASEVDRIDRKKIKLFNKIADYSKTLIKEPEDIDNGS